LISISDITILQLTLYGGIQFWTLPDGSGNCPSGFNLQMVPGICYTTPAISFFPATPTIDNTIPRVDLNTYQQINSDGRIYLDQKYRICTGIPCTNSYNTIQSMTTSTAYANSAPISYYGDGGGFHSTGDLVGECSACDSDKYGAANGVATFYDGTFANLLYFINSGGNTNFDASSGTGTYETNRNLLWWDSVSNSGGNNPIFSDTVIHGCSPLPDSDWFVEYNCTLRNTLTVPNNVYVGGTNASPTTLTIPSGVTLFAHLKQYGIKIGTFGGSTLQPGSIIIQPGGSINTN
jgi:hypothetical protein